MTDGRQCGATPSENAQACSECGTQVPGLPLRRLAWTEGRAVPKGALQLALLLALLIAAASGCGCDATTSAGSGPPAAASASPSVILAGEAEALSSALYNFTFTTSTYEPKGDVVAEGTPRVFVAAVDKVNVDRREITFDVVKLEDASREVGGVVDNGIVYRNDVRHRQTLRLASGVLPIYPRAGGVWTLDRFAKRLPLAACWMAVERGRILMCVPFSLP